MVIMKRIGADTASCNENMCIVLKQNYHCNDFSDYGNVPEMSTL